MPAQLTSDYYAHRLSVVRAARREAEAGARYGDVEALKLAEDVVAELLSELTELRS
jgi:hypothetical protein